MKVGHGIFLHTEIQRSITIAAAPDRVWHAFRQIEAWPRWYPGVLAAAWQEGEPWTPQAVMHLQVQNSLRQTVTSRADVYEVTHDSLLWENQSPGLRTLCRAQFKASPAGGARLTLQKRYRGAAVVLLRLLKARQEAMLGRGLGNLKQIIERTADGNPFNNA